MFISKDKNRPKIILKVINLKFFLSSSNPPIYTQHNVVLIKQSRASIIIS
jgi:hypothetical protein